MSLELQLLEVRQPKELPGAFSALTGWRAAALLVLPDPFFGNELAQISKLAAHNWLPAVYVRREFAEAGGLLAYGPSFPDNYRRAATYVDKILKGAKPADLPVEQPTKFELVINPKAAKALGVTIPPSLLERADPGDRMTAIIPAPAYVFAATRGFPDAGVSLRGHFRSGPGMPSSRHVVPLVRAAGPARDRDVGRRDLSPVVLGAPDAGARGWSFSVVRRDSAEPRLAEPLGLILSQLDSSSAEPEAPGVPDRVEQGWPSAGRVPGPCERPPLKV